jgi:demethylmenaquinone methyltransferase / 2-methoxy-6-polyprenyl-1,4-benzoquinol methylase
MFSRISRSYDRMNTLMSLGRDGAWRQATVEAAHPTPDEWVLDLGCGTGELSIAIQPSCKGVVGLDFCEDMLQAAGLKLQRRSLPITLIRADAHRMPFADATFGCIVTGFALRNVLSIEVVLREMLRVVKPGGRMACLELTPQGQDPIARITRLASDSIVPILGRLVTGEAEAYRYLPASVVSFPTTERFEEMIREAGWVNTGYRRLGFGAVAIHFGEKGTNENF